jgi:serine/threonine-protein kinase
MSYDEDLDRQSNPGLVPGTIIAGRFQVESKLGEGGMGAVYRATNIATGRWVALKAMHPEYAIKKEVVRRFMREAKAATAIRHPNVIEILDVVEAEGGEPVMVMELLDGETLDDLLTRMGPLPLGEVARIMTPVISAVGAAHGLGIIHRDLKPENIFLARGPDGGRLPKVLDFGIAKVLDPNQINELATKSGATRTGSMLGTPHYMSIEQACGEKDIDHRTDVWSLGIILYNMLSGHRPYDGENYGQILRALMTTTPPPIEKLVPGLPADIVDIVNRSTARTREERPKDLREVYEVLSRYTHDTTTQAPPSVAGSLMSREEMMSGVTLQAASVYVSKPSGGSVQQPGSKRLGLIVGVGLAFLLLGGGVGVALSFGREDPSAVAEPVASSAERVEVAPPPATMTSNPVVAVVGSANEPAPSASTAPPPPPSRTAKTGEPKHVPTSTVTATGATATTKPSSTGGGIIEAVPY